MEKNVLSHRVERSEIVAGDHIYTWRPLFAYAHHGVYAGENIVIHFGQHTEGSSSSGRNSSSPISSSYRSIFSSRISRSTQSSHASSGRHPSTCSNSVHCGFRQPGSGVVRSCLDCFLGKKGSLYRYQYAVSRSDFLTRFRGGCTTAEPDLPEQVIHRATYLLQNGFGKYHLGKNNCEDFALYCKTGLVVPNKEAPGTSSQINSLQALLSSLRVKKLNESFDAYCSMRYFRDIGVRNDVMKVAVENLPSFHSRLDEEPAAIQENDPSHYKREPAYLTDK